MLGYVEMHGAAGLQALHPTAWDWTELV